MLQLSRGGIEWLRQDVSPSPCPYDILPSRQGESQPIVQAQKCFMESSGFARLDRREVKGAAGSKMPVFISVYSLHSMQEGSQYLQSPWHSLRVKWAGKDGEVGSAAICNICTCKAFLVEVNILPIAT